MADYWTQKDIEDFRKHSHYKVGDRITYEVIIQRTTGRIIKVTHSHIRPSDGMEIPFHYTVRGDTDAPGAQPDIVFPKDILDGPTVFSRPMNVYVGGDRIAGSVAKTGIVSDSTNRIVGSVDNSGNIHDSTNRIVGSVDNSGNIYDRSNTSVGSVDYLGVVFERTKKVVGSVTGIHGGIEDIYFAGGAGLLLLLSRNK